MWILPSSWLSRGFPGPVWMKMRRKVGKRRRTLDPGFSSARLARRPPKNRPNLSLLYPQICGQGAYSSYIQVRDLAAQIDVHPHRFLKPYSTVRCSCLTLLGSRSLTCISLASALGCQMAPPATDLLKNKLFCVAFSYTNGG